MHTAWTSQAVNRRGFLLGLAFLGLIGINGCQNMTPTGNGLLAGGGLGAVTGAILGGAVGRPGAGAAIGAGLGAAAGGMVGSGIEETDRRQAARVAAVAASQPVAPALSMQDIVQLTRSGSSDAVIINQIRLSRSVYSNLGTSDIVYLQNEGVREAVIREMQQTAYRAPPRVVVQPATVVEPVYVAPAPVIGVSYGWGRRW